MEGAEGELRANGPARDEGDPEPGFDGGEQGFCGVEGHADGEVAESKAGGFEGLLDDAAGAGAELACKELGGRELAEGDGFAGPLVRGRDDENHVVLHEGCEVNILAEGWSFNEG